QDLVAPLAPGQALDFSRHTSQPLYLSRCSRKDVQFDVNICEEVEAMTDAITRVRTRAGDEAWHVSSYAELKQLLGDARLGRSHREPEKAPRISDSVLFGGPLENFETENEDHARMRGLLTPYFSARRMAALQPRVETLVDGLLDDLAAAAPPVDLHEALSFPLPVLVICELLGVPYEDRDQFRVWSGGMGDMHDQERAHASIGAM